MVRYYTKIFLGLSIYMVQLHAMNQQGSVGGLLNPQGIAASYLPEALVSLGNAGYALVAAGVQSAATTAQNYLSDDAAFAKLGFPPTEDVNQQELTRFKLIEDRHHKAILAYTFNEKFKLDAAYLERRQEYVKRAIKALHTHQDGIGLAIFCLKHYQSVMNPFDVSRVTVFLQHKQQKSVDKRHSIETGLQEVVVASDNPLVLNLLGSGALPKEEHKLEKKEEEKVESKKEKDKDGQ